MMTDMRSSNKLDMRKVRGHLGVDRGSVCADKAYDRGPVPHSVEKAEGLK